MKNYKTFIIFFAVLLLILSAIPISNYYKNINYQSQVMHCSSAGKCNTGYNIPINNQPLKNINQSNDHFLIPTNLDMQKGYLITNTSNNTGASISLETEYGTYNTSQSAWIGQYLTNGAFIQVGYFTVNKTAFYNTQTNQTLILLTQRVPTWFWEYFPANDTNNSIFYGGIGLNGSVGPTGTYNNYSMESVGNTWYFYFNNATVGSVDLGASTSNQEIFFMSEVKSNSSGYLPLNFKDLKIHQN